MAVTEILPELLSSTFLVGAALTTVGLAGALDVVVSSSSSELESDEELSAFFAATTGLATGLTDLLLTSGSLSLSSSEQYKTVNR